MWLDVGLALDPLQVSRALGIAVTSSIRSTSLVVTHTLVTILVHFHKIDGSVQGALGLGHFNSHRNLLANELELLVLIILCDEHTSADIDGIRSLGHIAHAHATRTSLCLVDTIWCRPLFLWPTSNS